MKPYFSVIIVSYNAGITIEQTIQSVLSQSYDNYEIIVKDAVSKDNTLSYIPKSDKIKVYSEKDTGIYDGMNSAIKYASGKYLIFLNCGDCFASSEVLQKVYEKSIAMQEEDCIIYGDYIRNEVLFKQPSKIYDFYLYRTPLCHQSMIFARTLFEKYGGYDLSFKICADYDFTVKTYKDKMPYVYIDIPICKYLGGGVSESKKGSKIKNNDYKVIKKKYFKKRERFFYSIKIFFSFRKLRSLLISDKSPKWIRKLYRKIVNKINK